MEAFEFLEHTADLHMRIRGKSPEELFQNALAGMFHVIRPENTSEAINRKLTVKGRDRESLLVNFLNELLGNLDIYKESYQKVHFETWTPYHLSATLSGFKIKGFGTQVKGATFHDLSIVEKKGTLEANVIFDI